MITEYGEKSKRVKFILNSHFEAIHLSIPGPEYSGERGGGVESKLVNFLPHYAIPGVWGAPWLLKYNIY